MKHPPQPPRHRGDRQLPRHRGDRQLPRHRGGVAYPNQEVNFNLLLIAGD